jgi:hypothetical protein
MAREVVGYTKLEWTCSNCKTVNPGPMKICSSCGSPRPEEVKFTQAAKEDLVQDEKEIQQAKAGADIQCAYCGAPNPATAAICVRCGADLKEGKQRQAGEVLGAHRSGPVGNIKCPNCGAENLASAYKCVGCGSPLGREPVAAPAVAGKKPFPYLLVAIAAVVLIGLVILISTCARRENVVGTVQNAEWTCAVVVEAYGPVTKEDFLDKIPSSAGIGSCELKLYETSTDPVQGDNVEKVCGTPYTVDKGSGFGEVVQDCEYKVYKDFCQYQVDEWHKLDELTNQGTGLQVACPVPQLVTNQRQGAVTESFKIVFNTDKGVKEYTTSDASLYSRAAAGSQWELTIDGFGNVVEVKPK